MVIKKNGATTIIAEIATIRIFLQEISLLHGLELFDVYQSADKFYRKKNNKLKDFLYRRINQLKNQKHYWSDKKFPQ